MSNLRPSHLLRLGGLGLILALWTSISLQGCDPGIPNLRASQEGAGSTVSLMLLGEYPSSVTRIRLRSIEHHRTIWEISAKDGPAFQIWALNFLAGENPTNPTGKLSGECEVLIPKDTNSFFLSRGVEYELEVWDSQDREKSVRFQLAPLQSQADR